VFPNVDRVFAGIFDPPTVLSLLDALDEADLLRRNFNTLGDVNRELAAERDALAEALAVAREALEEISRFAECENYTGQYYCHSENSGRSRNARWGADRWCDTCIARDALARIDTLTASTGEPT